MRSLACLAPILVLALVACKGDAPRANSNSGVAHPATAIGSSEQEKAFWTWFEKNGERLLAAIDADPVEVVRSDALNKELERIHSSLVFELPGDKVDGKQAIVISADGDRGAFPAVESLVAAAPKLDKWHVIAFRPRQPELDSFSLELGATRLSPQTVYYRSESDNNRLGLNIYLPGYTKDAEQLQMAALLLLDAVLGEYDVETEIGFIEMLALPDDRSSLRPLSKLRDEIDMRKRSRGERPG